MKRYQFTVIIMFLFSLSGCASHFVKIEKPNTPFERPSYTIYSPQGDGWIFYEKDEIGQHYLFLGLPQNTRTHTLYAKIEEIPSTAKFDTLQQFQSFFKNMIEVGFDPRRYKIIEEKIEPNNKFGDLSLTYYSLIEDHGAAYLGDAPYLVMETLNYVFIHPYKKTQLINVFYSERGKSGELDKNFREKAEAFISGLKLKK